MKYEYKVYHVFISSKGYLETQINGCFSLDELLTHFGKYGWDLMYFGLIKDNNYNHRLIFKRQIIDYDYGK